MPFVCTRAIGLVCAQGMSFVDMNWEERDKCACALKRGQQVSSVNMEGGVGVCVRVHIHTLGGERQISGAWAPGGGWLMCPGWWERVLLGVPVEGMMEREEYKECDLRVWSERRVEEVGSRGGGRGPTRCVSLS